VDEHDDTGSPVAPLENARTDTDHGLRMSSAEVHCPEYAGDDIIPKGIPYTRASDLTSGTCSGGRSSTPKEGTLRNYKWLGGAKPERLAITVEDGLSYDSRLRLVQEVSAV
jgi:hypothetical protein